MQHAPRRRSGFTLIEIMIVVVILGILASTVLPQFSTSQDAAKEAAMVTSLNMLRSQVQLYKLQHNGKLPTAAIATELTTMTDINGLTTGNVIYGPYITGQMPANPLNGNKRDVVIGAATGNTGWAYNETTGAVSPGNLGTDTSPASGRAYNTF